MAGIMHFSNFFRFMESAEHAFFRSLGFSVARSRNGLEVCLPRVHAECDYAVPLRFEDEVQVRLLVERKGTAQPDLPVPLQPPERLGPAGGGARAADRGVRGAPGRRGHEGGAVAQSHCGQDPAGAGRMLADGSLAERKHPRRAADRSRRHGHQRARAGRSPSRNTAQLDTR